MTRKRFVTLKYCTIVPLDLSLGFAYHVFRANDLYDPDYTATGHQPFGRDKYTAEYKKYVVLNSFISVTWCNTILLDVSGQFFVFSNEGYLDTSTVYGTSGMDGLMEIADCKQRAYWGDPNNKKTRAYVRWRCPNAREENWGAETTTSPPANNVHYFCVAAHTIPANTIGPVVYLRCELFFRTLFYDPKVVNFSS